MGVLRSQVTHCRTVCPSVSHALIRLTAWLSSGRALDERLGCGVPPLLLPMLDRPHALTKESRHVNQYGPTRQCERMQPIAADRIDHIHLTRQLTSPGEPYPFFASVSRGEFVALFRGVNIRATLGNAMSLDQRYRARVKAASLVVPPDTVFSHHSAAALWRLSLARTVADLAACTPFAAGVALADAALRRTVHSLASVPAPSILREDLLRELDEMAVTPGGSKARRAIEFADAVADRPGESMSRANMQCSRISIPQLQVALAGASGLVYIVDFWWPEFDMIGEFDGNRKYTDPAFLRGHAAIRQP